MDLGKFQHYRTSEHEWGYELTLVNNDSYCGKLLVLEGGGCSSLHYHPRKCETFIVVEGRVVLEVHGRESTVFTTMGEGERHTIDSGVPHRFRSLTLQSVILEVSTYHDDSDVVRLEPSMGFVEFSKRGL